MTIASVNFQPNNLIVDHRRVSFFLSKDIDTEDEDFQHTWLLQVLFCELMEQKTHISQISVKQIQFLLLLLKMKQYLLVTCLDLSVSSSTKE